MRIVDYCNGMLVATAENEQIESLANAEWSRQNFIYD